MDRTALANQHYESVAEYTLSRQEIRSPEAYLGYAALVRLSRTQEAEMLLQAWQKQGDTDDVAARWLIARAQGDRSTFEGIERSLEEVFDPFAFSMLRQALDQAGL